MFQFYFFILLFLSGCVATTTDVDRLADSLTQVQKSQADFIVKMDELNQSLNTLNAQLIENQKKTSVLTQKLDDVQTRLAGRMDIISQLLASATTQASVPIPSEIYRVSYGDYIAGRLDLAVSGFKNFIKSYPDSDLLDDAQFYLADCFLIKKDFVQARIEFDQTLAVSKDFRAAALLKRAYALAGLNQIEDQKATLKILIKEFPESPESQAAQQVISDLKKEESKKNKAKEIKHEKTKK